MTTKNILLRLNPTVHKAVKLQAEDEGKSVNLWLNEIICKELGIEIKQSTKLVSVTVNKVA